LTLASEYLVKKKRKYPPFYIDKEGIDRVQKLYQNLEPTLPSPVNEIISNGNVSMGEVGRTMPYVFSKEFHDGSSVIIFYSGQMDFVYAVARTLSGLGVHNTIYGPENKPTLSIDEVARDVALLFKQYKSFRGLPWNLSLIKYPTFDILESIHQWAEAIATCAELFMLAHEIGHIVLEKKKTQLLSFSEEREADTIATLLVTNYATKKGDDYSMFFAGAIFAIKIIEGLEKVGVQFPLGYPPAKQRIENVSACLLSSCPSTQYFHEISRIAVAYQDMMDSVLSSVKPLNPMKPNLDRIIGRLITELLEVVLGRTTKMKLSTDFLSITNNIPTEMKQQIITILHNYYVVTPYQDSFIDKETKMKIGKLVIEVLPLFQDLSE
jgi:hypothetical protein